MKVGTWPVFKEAALSSHPAILNVLRGMKLSTPSYSIGYLLQVCVGYAVRIALITNRYQALESNSHKSKSDTGAYSKKISNPRTCRVLAGRLKNLSRRNRQNIASAALVIRSQET